jgi:hypothetical protein
VGRIGITRVSFNLQRAFSVDDWGVATSDAVVSSTGACVFSKGDFSFNGGVFRVRIPAFCYPCSIGQWIVSVGSGVNV